MLAAEFGDVSAVAPRILTTTTQGSRLVATRTMLGIEIGRIKDAYRAIDPTGIQIEIDPPGE